MAIGIEYKGLAPSGIPIPPAAPHDPDPNPSTYIPTGMSKQDRENLKAAAIEWTNTLGASSVMNATISTLTSKGRAADNMSHYRHGGGSTKVFSEDDVSDIRHEVPAVASFETNNLELFLNMVHEDFKTRGIKQVVIYRLIQRKISTGSASMQSMEVNGSMLWADFK